MSGIWDRIKTSVIDLLRDLSLILQKQRIKSEKKQTKITILIAVKC